MPYFVKCFNISMKTPEFQGQDWHQKLYIYQGQLIEFGFCMGPCDESLIGSYLVFLKICESGVENKHWTIAVPHTCNEEV